MSTRLAKSNRLIQDKGTCCQSPLASREQFLELWMSNRINDGAPFPPTNRMLCIFNKPICLLQNQLETQQGGWGLLERKDPSIRGQTTNTSTHPENWVTFFYRLPWNAFLSNLVRIFFSLYHSTSFPQDVNQLAIRNCGHVIMCQWYIRHSIGSSHNNIPS